VTHKEAPTTPRKIAPTVLSIVELARLSSATGAILGRFKQGGHSSAETMKMPCTERSAKGVKSRNEVQAQCRRRLQKKEGEKKHNARSTSITMGYVYLDDPALMAMERAGMRRAGCLAGFAGVYKESTLRCVAPLRGPPPASCARSVQRSNIRMEHRRTRALE
jgi:hypothetical protein